MLTFNQVLIIVADVMDEPESLSEPLSPGEVRRIAREILQSGTVGWSSHAKKEMAADDLTMVDCVNVIRAGAPRAGEYENGTYRYQIETAKMVVVVAFRSSSHLIVVTAWRVR
jgi:hypothetical protein